MIKNILQQINAQVFPANFNNDFKGYKISLWIFYAFTAVTIWRSQHHVFAPDGGAQTIATIPLDSFTNGGATTTVSIFALWGISQLVIAMIYVLACFRYRALIPLLYLLAIFEYVMRFAYVGMYKPIETTGDAPGAIANIPASIILLVLFALAIRIKLRK